MKTRIIIAILGLFILFGFKAKSDGERLHIITVYQVDSKYILEINNALSDDEVCNLLYDLYVNKCQTRL